MEKMYALIIQGNFSTIVTTHQTEEEAIQELEKYVERCWEELGVEEAFPLGGDAIETYFEYQDEESAEIVVIQN